MVKFTKEKRKLNINFLHSFLLDWSILSEFQKVPSRIKQSIWKHRACDNVLTLKILVMLPSRFKQWQKDGSIMLFVICQLPLKERGISVFRALSPWSLCWNFCQRFQNAFLLSVFILFAGCCVCCFVQSLTIPELSKYLF